MTRVSILLAEDFAPFREFACRELKRRQEFCVVAVNDGLAAVSQAEELQPDLVLLDIGLPSLDGFAAARRIRSVSPAARIVFLTQESSPDSIHEALTLGAHGYILKTAAKHLLPAVEAILDSGRANGKDGDPDGNRVRDRAHRVQFCSNDSTLIETAEHFLASALNAHDAAIAVATRSHLEQLTTRLAGWGIDVERVVQQGSCVLLDRDALISRVLIEERARWEPDMMAMIEAAAAATKRPRPRVAIFGEVAPALWAAGHVDEAICIEELAHQLAATNTTDVLCAYPLQSADGADQFKAVCAQHGAIIIR